MGGFASLAAFAGQLGSAVFPPEISEVGVLALAGVFIMAGAAKVRRPSLAAQAITDFGGTKRPVRALGLGLGTAELLVGIGLILALGRMVWLGAATMMLWLFAYAIARKLGAGSEFPCFCFGEGTEPISRLTLVRTVSLAALVTVLLLTVPDTRGSDPRVLAMTAVLAAALFSCALLLGEFPRLVRLGRHEHGASTS